METKDEKIEEFFRLCMEGFERSRCRKPGTIAEMWEAVIEGMELEAKEKPS